MKLSTAFDLYERDKKLSGYSSWTLKGYGLQSRLLIKYLGDIDLEDIELYQLKEYLSECFKKLKPSSIAFRIKYIRSLFRWAVDEGYINKM